MRLFFTSAYKVHTCLKRVFELQALDRHREFSLTSDPAAADAIIFIENTQFSDIGFSALLAHPLVSQYPEKVFMYNEADLAWPVLPGLYCSLASELANEDHLVAFPYLTVANTGISEIYQSNARRKWLYSFVGARSHPLRRQLLTLGSDDARIVDTSGFCTWNPAQASRYAYQKLYTDTMASSKFVLCPRGVGPASLRLYETMEAGRVPVIISDSWAPPPQVDWSFAVRIPESQVATIPDVLRELEPEWLERGEAARKTWGSAYAPEQLFHSLGLAIRAISHPVNMPRLTWPASALKWRVTVKQAVKNRLQPAAPGPVRYPSLLHRLFSRNA
ncbi:MAG: exostosin family protein [Granulosicoccus sp.]|nr:exostosin family protein [Granulosicoccus sp.]